MHWVGAILMALIPYGVAADAITSARYADPTTRYAHGVLGDAIESGTLTLTLSDGRSLRMILPDTHVFEDIAPRLADLDGDGFPEVITVESSQSQGARLAIYDATGRITATPYIGTRNRWLAPIGAADLDGDGNIEIAYIDRPHLAKTLRVWRYEGGMLTELASKAGLTNHKIGWDFIAGGVRDCGDTPELITASADWAYVRATRLQDGALITKTIGKYSGPDSLSAPLRC